MDERSSERDGEATVRLTAGQAIVRYLAAQWSERDGVRRRVVPGMFGIFGHGNVCGIGQALEQDEGAMPYYQPKNEQAMVHAAIGFAKASARLSTLACTASIGPGATNMVTGAATATVNRIPVLLLASDTFASRLQGPPMQAIDDAFVGDLTVNDCLRPVSRYFDRISRPEQLIASLPAAISVLLDPEHTGAVTLAVHQDVQAEAYDFPRSLFAERTWLVPRRPPAEEELAPALERLRAARRPLIVAGGGVHYAEAGEALRRLAERLGAPVAETSAGKGAMVGGHPLAVGAIGHSGTRAANRLAREADLVLHVGTRLIDLTTGSNTLFQHPDVAFVGVNVAPADAGKLGATRIVADARTALEALDARLAEAGHTPPSGYGDEVVAAVAQWSADLAEDLQPRPGELISQAQVLHALNVQAGPEDALVVASGTPHVDIHKLWDTRAGTRILMEVGFSCMGHEIPAALGVRMADAHPGEVYAVIGDGTYLMGASELVTAVQEGQKITVLVFENHGFQSIHALQRGRTGRSFGLEFRHRDRTNGNRLTAEYVAVDLVANARSFGATAFEAATLDEVRDALAAARREAGPCVIVARVEPQRLMLDSECWWDVGIAEVSTREETRAARAAHDEGRVLQRHFA